MITKGIVEKLIDKNHIKVRVPIYDKSTESPDCVKTDDLTVATVCSPAGIQQHYCIGDVVYLAFEQDQRSEPVILGRLQTAELSKSTSDIRTDSIEVLVNYKLPVEGDSINNGAVGVSNDFVNQEIVALEQRIRDLETQLSYDVGDVMFTTNDATPEEMRYGGTWEPAADTFIMKFNDTTTPVYIWKKVEK